MKRKPKSAKAATKSIVILISGQGSNMHALLKASLPCKVAAVISNRANAPGLSIAEQCGITTEVVAHDGHSSRESFDTKLAAQIDNYQPDLIVLAGFMRILSPWFVEHYKNKLINIHPSLLPAYGGLNTHARALQDGVKIHGCTVHFVANDVDSGPIIIQAAVPVLTDDTPTTLAARVLDQEHRILPQAIHWFCNDQLSLSADGRVLVSQPQQSDCALISPQI